MRRFFLIFCSLFVFFLGSYAQTGCPGCSTVLPANLPADTIFNTQLPTASKGRPYAEDLSFRLPITTTPVSQYDSLTPPGIPINKFEIVSISGLPAGMSWQANKTAFAIPSETDGCIRLCGTPQEIGDFRPIVHLKVNVLILTRDANFGFDLKIEAPTATNDGFSMSNNAGCAPLTVNFTNNHPSGGNPGFQYLWDFGDGDSTTAEAPGTHTFTTPGQYVVGYTATVDTVGISLKKVEFVDMACSDAFGLGAPDLYFRILDTAGVEVFNSSPYINNASIPYTFDLNFAILPDVTYKIEAWDEDSGLEGSDDFCGSVSFTHTTASTDTLVGGDLIATVTIEHPIVDVLSYDTVVVYFQPSPPTIFSPALTTCAPNTVFLTSSSASGNSWYRNDTLLLNQTEFFFEAVQSGVYVLRITSTNGCFAESNPTTVEIVPRIPIFPIENDNNYLYMADTANLSQNSAQWYLNQQPIPGATTLEYCATETGGYQLVLTDPASGCTAASSISVIHNPVFDCTVATTAPALLTDIHLYPNPVRDNFLYIRAENEYGLSHIRLFDALGRLVFEKTAIQLGQTPIQLSLEHLTNGIYAIQISSNNKQKNGWILVND